MAILKGLPSFNYKLPKTIEIQIKIKNLPYEEKFKTTDNQLYLKLYNPADEKETFGLKQIFRGVCYYVPNGLSCTEEAGDIRYFDSEEIVIWLKTIFNEKEQVIPGDCCQFCATKLIVDQFSSNLGDFCPNENCVNQN